MRRGEKFVCPDASDDVKRDARRWLENPRKRPASGFPLARPPPPVRIAPGDARRGHAHGQELLGRKSTVTTVRYAHLSRDYRAAAVEKMNAETKPCSPGRSRRNRPHDSWEKIDTNSRAPARRPNLGPFWTWKGNRDQGGYGRLGIESAHRIAYKLCAGKSPPNG